MGGPGAPDVASPCDIFVRRGGAEEVFRPGFTWHGFRYVQIEGLKRRPGPGDVLALPLSAEVADAGTWRCSSPLFNRIHEVCRNTFLSNLMGVQSDCPARERFGYGADIAATTESFILNFDMRTYLREDGGGLCG
jgi:alpha-L-rhamnosidase